MAGPFFGGSVFSGGFFGGSTPSRAIAEGLRRKREKARKRQEEELMMIIKTIAPLCFDRMGA